MDSPAAAAKSPKLFRSVTWYAILLILGLTFTSIYRGARSVSLCAVMEERPPATVVTTTTTETTTPSYELAKTESFGFFDDIDDATWRRHQHRARTEHVYHDPSNPSRHYTDPARWLLFNVDPLFTCPNLRRVGGRGDGPKWTCDPHRLVQKPDCLIYSVGSRGVYSFEDGIVQLLKQYDPTTPSSSSSSENDGSWVPNCEIHVFDPAPQYGRKGDAQKNIHYHAIGLKSSYEAFQFESFPTTYEFLTFPEIQKRLGHENRRIDIFKIDCEHCEWATYQDWLHPDIDIRQVLVETHGLRPQPHRLFDRFLDVGLVPFSKEANTHPGAKPYGQLFEWGFVKLHTDFTRRSTNLLNITY